ncbi:DgyrCDS13943 [Dimorphilus gyrociliatus]|uniref:Acyl-coenzyme A oxidase n=1 Tax=Dimorphilus gyrociliatus TaxID=2664684 RepID=A0A7I8WC53_9ANNE|nr:DgyrCDS13943 [Dimorphilus gyrociliatus]
MAGTVNPDLQAERDRISFEQEALTNAIDGTPEKTEKRRKYANLALNDPDFDMTSYNFLSRSEKYGAAVEKTVKMIKKIGKLGITDPTDLYIYRSHIFPNESTSFTLHADMFIPTLMGQASPKQQSKWLPKALTLQIIGTYAQTELGHGTFIRGLETTATYDEKTEEFVIHSPTRTSLKWWPGNLGKSTNHAIVMAQLIVKGQNYGPHPFIVQIRSLENHMPQPGVTLGDIGPKFGYDANDNGFMQFDHVRIPRENMLMKHSRVEPDGTYIKAKNSKLTYGTMVFVRSVLIRDVAALSLAQCATIAIRYSCVRRQSEIKPGAGEPKVMDYRAQQAKLFPQLATAYAFLFVAQEMENIYFSVNSEIDRGEIDRLPELHGLSSALKAFTTDWAVVGMEICRRSCGGHGFSHCSGIPKIYVNALPGVTYEGENTVMYLQAARYLVKCVNMAKRGDQLPGSVAFLNKKPAPKSSITEDVNMVDLVEAYRARAYYLVHMASFELDREIKNGMASYDAWNECAVALVMAAKAYGHYVVVEAFAKKLETLTNNQVPASVIGVLTLLGKLYALHGILENSGDFMSENYLSKQQKSFIYNGFLYALKSLRPDAVGLVDAFEFPDKVLDSVLGRYDGRVYENMLEWAMKDELNKTQVHESYFKHIRPFVKQASKL